MRCARCGATLNARLLTCMDCFTAAEIAPEAFLRWVQRWLRGNESVIDLSYTERREFWIAATKQGATR